MMACDGSRPEMRLTTPLALEIRNGRIFFTWSCDQGALGEREGHLYSIVDRSSDGELIQIELNCLLHDLRLLGKFPQALSENRVELNKNEAPFIELTGHDYVAFIRWPNRQSTSPVNGVVHEARLLIDSDENAIGVAINS